MYDDFKVANYSKVLLSPELYARHLSRLFTGDVIDGFTVAPGTGLQVVLAPGNALIRYGSTNVASAREVSLVANFNLTIGTADVSNPRIDLVVVYVDNGVTLPSGTPTSANLDGKGVAKAMIVQGTAAASPSAPNSTAIQSSVGSGNPYTVVAQVRVDAGVSVIAANKIADVRGMLALTTALAPASVSKSEIDFPSGVWWEELGRATLSSNGSVINVPLSGDRKFIKVHVICNGFSAAVTDYYIRVNNISSADYGGRVTVLGSSYNTYIINNGTSARIWSSTSDWPRHIESEIDIYRPNAGSGLAIGTSSHVVIGATIAGVAAAPVMTSFSLFNSSLPALTTLSIHTAGGLMVAGSTVVVVGHD